MRLLLSVLLAFTCVFAPRGSAQTGDESNLVLTIVGGVVTGHPLWTIDRQPLQPGDVPQTFADITKARALLAYDPQTQIEDGIHKFVEWFRGRV